jgi:hypothetical protein
MLPADGLAGSVTVIAADVVLTGYARPATAVKDAVCTVCQANVPLIDGVTFPAASSWSDLAAAIVMKTSLVPAEKVTAEPAFEDE